MKEGYESFEDSIQDYYEVVVHGHFKVGKKGILEWTHPSPMSTSFRIRLNDIDIPDKELRKLGSISVQKDDFLEILAMNVKRS